MLWSIFITYIITHHGLGGFSGLINGLIAAAIGALSMLMSEPTAKSHVKRTCMFVLSIATFTFTPSQTPATRLTCKVVLLIINPIGFLRLSLLSPSSLFKPPIRDFKIQGRDGNEDVAPSLKK